MAGFQGQVQGHTNAATEVLVVAVLVLVFYADAIFVTGGATARRRAAATATALYEALGHRDALLVPTPPAAEAVVFVVVLVACLAAVASRGAGFILYQALKIFRLVVGFYALMRLNCVFFKK